MLFYKMFYEIFYRKRIECYDKTLEQKNCYNKKFCFVIFHTGNCSYFAKYFFRKNKIFDNANSGVVYQIYHPYGLLLCNFLNVFIS